MPIVNLSPSIHTGAWALPLPIHTGAQALPLPTKGFPFLKMEKGVVSKSTKITKQDIGLLIQGTTISKFLVITDMELEMSVMFMSSLHSMSQSPLLEGSRETHGSDLMCTLSILPARTRAWLWAAKLLRILPCLGGREWKIAALPKCCTPGARATTSILSHGKRERGSREWGLRYWDLDSGPHDRIATLLNHLAPCSILRTAGILMRTNYTSWPLELPP